jgi:hypothetical protein
VEDAAVVPADLAGAGWRVQPDLPGFRKVTELQRKLADARPVRQVVYSDGLAAVSVFIEPLQAARDPVRASLSSAGAIHVYTREVANHRVTVVGEAPAALVGVGEAVPSLGVRIVVDGHAAYFAAIKATYDCLREQRGIAASDLNATELTHKYTQPEDYIVWAREYMNVKE